MFRLRHATLARDTAATSVETPPACPRPPAAAQPMSHLFRHACREWGSRRRLSPPTPHDARASHGHQMPPPRPATPPLPDEFA